MFNKLLNPWPLRLVLKKISGLVILITGVLIVVLSGLSYYGNSVGDLVVTVDDVINRALSLSETGEFTPEDASTMLAARGITDIRDSTYYYIPENIREGNGLKSDTKNNMYFAYSFYLKNASDVSVSYSATVTIDRVLKNLDSAIRIMILVDDNEPMIFARPKADGTPESLEEGDGSVIKKGYTTIPFTGNEFSAIKQSALEIDEIQKYTIVVWLEGWDADCTDAIMYGGLEVSIDFRILEGE